MTGGPYLNVLYLKLGEWYLTSFEAKEIQDGVSVSIRGGYRDTLTIEWRILIHKDGSFTTEYTIGELFKELPRQIKLRVGVDGGGLDELGVSYLAAPGMDMLSWKRRDNILYGCYDAQYSGTNDFRSTKEDVEEACLYSVEKGIGISLHMANILSASLRF